MNIHVPSTGRGGGLPKLSGSWQQPLVAMSPMTASSNQETAIIEAEEERPTNAKYHMPNIVYYMQTCANSIIILFISHSSFICQLFFLWR